MADKKESNRGLPPPPIPPMNLPVDKEGNIIREVSGHEDRSIPPDMLVGSPDKATTAAKKALGLGGSTEIDPEDDDGVTPVPPGMGIAVKAIRPGFYRNQRILEGDFFQIPNMDSWGDWMVLADDKEEAKRQEKIKADKKAEREKAKEDAGK